MEKLGTKDTITKDYLKNPKIFADAFNKYLYRGRQVIQPQQLAELDTAEIIVPYGSDEADMPEQRYRDVLKLMMTDGKRAYCILGIEEQSRIHYAMPVRNMVYDALQLAHQVSEAARSHKAEAAMTRNMDVGGYRPSADEFLSGFYKKDRLLPVVTLVIYFGPDEWDAPLSLSEMYAETDKVVLQYAADYKVNLIAPNRMSDEEMKEFTTSLKEVMIYIKYSKDKSKLDEALQKDENFRRLDRQAAGVINVNTDSNLKYENGQGEIDMCKAIQDMRAESEMIGRQEGILLTKKVIRLEAQGCDPEEIARQTGITEEEVRSILA